MGTVVPKYGFSFDHEHDYLLEGGHTPEGCSVPRTLGLITIRIITGREVSQMWNVL